MTPIAHTMRVEHIADRAAAYAMPGERVDGNDPVAVYGGLTAAVERARSGGGPTLLECVTYRFNGHFFGDPMAYIPSEELEQAIAADPVPRFRAVLKDDGRRERGRPGRHRGRRASARSSEALDEVLASPPPAADEIERDVYASMTGVPQ